MTQDLLLELYSEELPCSEQIDAQNSYYVIFTKALSEKNIQYNSVKVFTTCCRITVLITNIKEKVLITGTQIKGPKVNSTKQALEGFCKKHNIEQKELQQIQIHNEQYWAYNQTNQHIESKTILLNLLPNLIDQHSWKKSVFSEYAGVKWARPLKNILCILGNQVLQFKYHNLYSNQNTFGHKLASFVIDTPIISFQQYTNILLQHNVILDVQDRKKQINTIVQSILEKQELKIQIDQELFTQILHCFEYPIPFICKINPQHLKVIPNDIIKIVLKEHQRCIAVYNKHNELAPYFIFISNNLGNNKNKVIMGVEKCVEARLQDITFFLKKELNNSIHNKLDDLKKIIFHTKLGSIEQKIQRLHNVAIKLSITDNIYSKNNDYYINTILQAIKFLKCDLSSEITNDLPETRGYLAAYFYKVQNAHEYNNDVYEYIYNQYKKDINNTQKNKVLIISLIDKIDNIVGLYLAGERATGSQDKYNIRKQIIEIIQILSVTQQNNTVLHKIDFLICKETKNISQIKINLLENLLEITINSYIEQNKVDLSIENKTKIINEIILYIKNRHTNILKNQYKTEVIRSVFYKNINTNILCKYNHYNINLYTNLVKTIDNLIENENQKIYDIIIAFKRISNIVNEKIHFIPEDIIQYINTIPKTENQSIQCKLQNVILTFLENQKNNQINIEQDIDQLHTLTKYVTTILDTEKIYDKNGNIISKTQMNLISISNQILNNVIAFKELLNTIE